MRRVNRLGLAQRIVLVVALAAALRILARWLLIEDGPTGGWFSYSPDEVTLTRSADPLRFSDTVTIVVSMALIGVWAAVAVWLFRPTRPDASDE